ncbi:DNA glycosylase [Stemphylium lycopersici]|nr:DNA glycosylase [Stemphylium lycopersici]
MSLRRSARVASTNTSEVPASKSQADGARYETVSKSNATAKKRKPTKAGATPSPADTTKEPKTSARRKKASDEPDSKVLSQPHPATPLPKKRKSTSTAGSPINPPPFTPTPAAVAVLSKGKTESDHPLDDLSQFQPRAAEPHATNATLATPNGSHTVQAYGSSPARTEDPSPARKRKAKELVPPDVGAIPSASTDIDRLLKDAEAHLVGVDPTLKALVEKHHCKIFSPEGLSEVVDPFTALSSGIIGQQVSGQAAASIRSKFTALFPTTHPSFPSPAQVLELSLPTLRTAGLSQRKAEYIYGLAEKFASGELSAEMLVSASDEELIEKLVAVRGLGRWSVEMFACFGLKRMDVFSTGDLGVQRGMAIYAGRDVNKLKNKGGKWKYMSEQEMLSTASKFSPYRSLFMWYMWRIGDVDVSVMQKS